MKSSQRSSWSPWGRVGAMLLFQNKCWWCPRAPAGRTEKSQSPLLTMNLAKNVAFWCTRLLQHGDARSRAGLPRALPRLQRCPLAGSRCPDHTDSWSVAILFVFPVKRSWILVAVETSNPNYKEFNSLNVKSYGSFSLIKKKKERNQTHHKTITP